MLADRIGVPQLREMAGRSEQIVADVVFADIARLTAMLYTDAADGVADGSVRVDVRFVDHGQGFPEVECRVHGTLPLQCQRCLLQMDWPAEIDFRLAVIGSEAELERVPDRFDAVVADEHGFSLAEAVADELLGSLPLAPCHADLADCGAVTAYLLGGEGDAETPDAGQETNKPFAGLADMVAGKAVKDGTDQN